MADSCAQYVSADDLKAAKESILHIEHVATSKDANGNPALVVTDPIRGVGYTNATLDGLFSDIGFKPVNGSFEDGGTLVNRWDVLLYETNGSFYQWVGVIPVGGLVVSAGSSPFDSGGNLLPGWVDQTDLTLRSELSTDGEPIVNLSRVKASPQGSLDQMITWVTPEQFGAIGDGTIHPLSERYTTLLEAQAVYPHVTSLTQTIDWAACQAAENYARGVCRVVAREFAEYHFGRDGLIISQYSHWQGGMAVSQGLRNCAFKKTFPTTTPTFQQDYIVRVSPEQNDNPFGVFYYKDNISFKGFRLYYDVARRYPTKSTNTICMHIGDMVKGELDIAVWGAEYGVYTWVAWGNKGHIRIDNCHKGFFSVPHLGDNERAGSGTITSNHLNIECDVTPFPITVGRDSYSHYTGYFEGSVSTDGNYDSANETACGITIIGASTGCTFNMGIEKWQGVHITKTSNEAAEVNFRFGWFTDDHYKMSTGNDGSDASLRAITGTTASKISLPAAQRAYINVLQGNTAFTLSDTSWYMGGIFTETSSTRYLVNLQNTASVLTFVGGSTGFTPEVGAAPVAFSVTEAMKKQVEVYGCRNMELWCAPSTAYRLVGRNKWMQTTKRSVSGVVDAAGQYADFTAPDSAYTVMALEGLGTNLGLTGNAITFAPSTIGLNGNAMRAVTAYTGGTVLTFQAWVYLTQ